MEVEEKAATIGVRECGRARDFVLRASPKIETVNTTGGSVNMARYYGITSCLLWARQQPLQPKRVRTRAVGFVLRVALRGPSCPWQRSVLPCLPLFPLLPP